VRTSPLAILLFIIAAFLGALGQFFYKSGAEKTDSTFASYIINARLLAGVVCYVAVMVLFVAAFKRGGALTVLYPIYATRFTPAPLFSPRSSPGSLMAHRFARRISLVSSC
jgi:uncharacterized membrane protein